MPESVKVFAPATVANVSCGFDVLGFAVDQPGDEVVMRKSPNPGVVITLITGDGGRLSTDPEKNTVGVAALALLKATGIQQGIEIELHKKMPFGSGMGSSSASAVAGAFAANELLGRPLDRAALLPFAMLGEEVACGTAHADNVAPALYGGFVLIRSYHPLDVVEIPVPDELYATIIHPDIEVPTKDAREVLKKRVPLPDAIVQWGNVGGLIAGLMKSDYGLIGRSLEDVIIEPMRSVLIPAYHTVKKAALEAGALGSGISGSGPSIFSLSKGIELAQKVGKAKEAAFQRAGIDCTVYVSKVNKKGPVVLESIG